MYFEHVYLLLAWNLACRTNNVANLWLSDLQANNDHLTILLGLVKNDQAAKYNTPVAIYANPLQVEICCITAIARYLVEVGPSLKANEAKEVHRQEVFKLS